MTISETPQTSDAEEAEALSHELWKERNLLGSLLYKFITQRLLVSNGESRWLGHCTSEIESLKEQLATCQLSIDLCSVNLSRTWGMDTDEPPTLKALIEAAPEDSPWKDIMEEHHEALQRVTQEIRDVSGQNQRLLKAASISLQDAGQHQSPVTYTASGSAASSTGAALVDRSG